MDPISFTIGVVGLVGTFTACVECFDFIRIGRNLGEDYQTAIVKLDLVRLRFTRWGLSVGITEGTEEIAVAQLKSNLAYPDKDFAIIKRTLGEILHQFENVAQVSKRQALKAQKGDASVSDGVDLKDAAMEDLHQAMRSLAIQRQKRSSVLQKMTWALYRKNTFTELIANLTDLVAALVDLAPAKPQQQICIEEVREIRNDKSLIFLDDILQGEEETIDQFLQAKVSDAIEQRRGTMATTEWKRNKLGEGSQVHQGDFVASNHQGSVLSNERNYLVQDSEFGKNVVFHQGNSYGQSEH